MLSHPMGKQTEGQLPRPHAAPSVPVHPPLPLCISLCLRASPSALSSLLFPMHAPQPPCISSSPRASPFAHTFPSVHPSEHFFHSLLKSEVTRHSFLLQHHSLTLSSLWTLIFSPLAIRVWNLLRIVPGSIFGLQFSSSISLSSHGSPVQILKSFSVWDFLEVPLPGCGAGVWGSIVPPTVLFADVMALLLIPRWFGSINTTLQIRTLT